MEDASADVTPELLDALLSGTNSKRLEELASLWRHAQSPKLLAAVCGLRFPPLPEEGESTAVALQVAMAKLLDSAVKSGAQGPSSPLLGTLQTLPPQGARQVMTRISKLYSLVVGMMVSAESKCLSDPLLQLLVQLQLISGTPLRSLRQAASAAALGALQALLAERHVARGALAELETQKRALMDAAGDAAAAARLARLCRGSAQLEALTQQMDAEVGKLQERVLLRRLQDTAAIVRRFTLNALGRYMQLQFLWTPERILQGFFDPAPEVRLQAIEIAGAWLEGDLDDALLRQVAHHLAERSRDSEPRVSAAALRHLRHPVLVSQLSDDDFARVALLALTAPDSHGLLRVEAALFVEQHLLPEPGLGIAAKKQPGEEGDDLELHFITEHGLMAVADFLTSYLPDNDQLHLSRRFVEALWLRTDAFRRWSALADLCLLGEGQGAARGVPCLPNRQRLALLVVLDAALKCAEVPSDATEALLPRLPRLFELFTAEGLCFLDVLASISRRLICAACQKDSEAPLPRALLPPLLAALRRGRVHAQLQLAEGLVAWAERSSEVQTATRQLVLDLYSSLSLQLSSPSAELSQVLGPLLALGHRGVDLWNCDKIGLGNKIFGSALSILEADGQPEGVPSVSPVSPRVAAELLQLLALLSCWRARCLLGEASKENSGFLMWCHLIRASCSKVMAGETNHLLLRLEAFSCYLLLLHLEFLGHKDTQGLPKVPEHHLTSIDLALRDFYAGSTKSSSCWRQSAAQLGGRDVTICRWLIDRYLREADVTTPESWEEVKAMVASCASRMLAECQHEAIYTSSAAERLLQHLGHVEGDPGKSGSDTQVAALQLLSRLRRYGGRSAHEASQGYQMQFRAAARHAKENGLEAGLQLANTLIHWSAPPIIAGSRAATQLGRGMALALNACAGKGETEKIGLDLEVLVPWLRDAGCPLPGPAAQKLATQLADDFGLLGQSITAHPQKRPRPWRLTSPAGVWPLVTALQAIGSRLPRSNSWQAKLQETAKRRLAKRRPTAAAPSTQAPSTAAALPATWLAPLEKKCTEATVKRKRNEDVAQVTSRSAPRLVQVAPQASPAKRKWQLKND